AEALGIEVGIEGDRSPLPCICELAAGQLQPFMRLRLVDNVAAIEADGLLLEEISKRVVGGSRVVQDAGGHVDAADEILAQSSFHPQAQANALADARSPSHSARVKTAAAAGSQKAFSLDADIAGETEAPERRIERGDFF